MYSYPKADVVTVLLHVKVNRLPSDFLSLFPPTDPEGSKLPHLQTRVQCSYEIYIIIM